MLALEHRYPRNFKVLMCCAIVCHFTIIKFNHHVRMITLIILNKDNYKLSFITSPEVCGYSMSQRTELTYA